MSLVWLWCGAVAAMKRRTSRDDDSDAVGSDAEDEPKLKHAAFADAMNKLLQRSLKTDKGPVLAKRHTAAEKRVALERVALRDAKAAVAVKETHRKAHMSTPTVEPNVVLEKALRRIATSGGESCD